MDIPMKVIEQILSAKRMGTVQTLFRTAMNAENLRLYEVALVEQEAEAMRAHMAFLDWDTDEGPDGHAEFLSSLEEQACDLDEDGIPRALSDKDSMEYEPTHTAKENAVYEAERAAIAKMDPDSLPF